VRLFRWSQTPAAPESLWCIAPGITLLASVPFKRSESVHHPLLGGQPQRLPSGGRRPRAGLHLDPSPGRPQTERPPGSLGPRQHPRGGRPPRRERSRPGLCLSPLPQLREHKPGRQLLEGRGGALCAGHVDARSGAVVLRFHSLRDRSDETGGRSRGPDSRLGAARPAGDQVLGARFSAGHLWVFEGRGGVLGRGPDGARLHQAQQLLLIYEVRRGVAEPDNAAGGCLVVLVPRKVDWYHTSRIGSCLSAGMRLAAWLRTSAGACGKPSEQGVASRTACSLAIVVAMHFLPSLTQMADMQVSGKTAIPYTVYVAAIWAREQLAKRRLRSALDLLAISHFRSDASMTSTLSHPCPRALSCIHRTVPPRL
jgi:hypothetical protein